MKVADYKEILQETPTVVPVFRISRLPQWLKDKNRYAGPNWYSGYAVDIGTEVYPDRRGDSVILWEVGKGHYNFGCLALTPTYLTFVEYRKVEPDRTVYPTYAEQCAQQFDEWLGQAAALRAAGILPQL